MKITKDSYAMPATAKRLISFALFTAQATRPSDMQASISLDTLASMFGFNKANQYEELKQAITTAFKQSLEYKNGSHIGWMFWLTYYKLDLESNILIMEINNNLYDYVRNLRRSLGFSSLLPSDYLQRESQMLSAFSSNDDGQEA
jgi:plasmid replication initiation protein